MGTGRGGREAREARAPKRRKCAGEPARREQGARTHGGARTAHTGRGCRIEWASRSIGERWSERWRVSMQTVPYSRNAGKEIAFVVVLSPKPVALSHQASDPPWVTSVDAIRYTA